MIFLRALALLALCAPTALSGLAAGSARAAPILSEVLYDAEGADDGGVFVELAGLPGELLDGLALEGVNGSNGDTTGRIELEGRIAADGLFVLADLPASGPSPFERVDLFADFDFQNGPDSVLLLDADGRVLDALGYGVFSAEEVFAGEGAPAPDVSAGASLARRFADVDTDDNAADFVVLDVPTPGAAMRAAPVPVPEPAPPLLGLAALLTLGGLARSQAAGRGKAAKASPGRP